MLLEAISMDKTACKQDQNTVWKKRSTTEGNSHRNTLQSVGKIFALVFVFVFISSIFISMCNMHASHTYSLYEMDVCDSVYIHITQTSFDFFFSTYTLLLFPQPLNHPPINQTKPNRTTRSHHFATHHQGKMNVLMTSVFSSLKCWRLHKVKQRMKQNRTNNE